MYSLKSPSGRIKLNIDCGKELCYNVFFDEDEIISNSRIDLQVGGNYLFNNNNVVSKSEKTIKDTIKALFYRKNYIESHCNEILLNFDNKWSVQFRVYDDGVAYRMINSSNHQYKIKSEFVEYNFPIKSNSFIPYVAEGEDGNFESQFFNTFENTYTVDKLDSMNTNRLAFLPILVKAKNKINICITEADLFDYPGLYLRYNGNNCLLGVHAKYPKTKELGGYRMLQQVVKEREDYIAVVKGKQALPWRIAVISDNDTDIAASDLTYLLASPSKIEDTSWIIPGKVAWEWWNDWGIYDIDFTAGVNTSTYKEYIDFASKNGIEYVILDEGWSVNLKADLFQVVDSIDLEEIVRYAESKKVGIILWAGYYAFARDMENVCEHYSKMGIKGFKIDFLNRDDSEMISFIHNAAMICAKNKMVLDIHGAFKPAGLNRTYPNILNFEGVHGMEQMKWSKSSDEQVIYDVTIPFIRQVAGPMDYTQGAMRNSTRENYYPSNSEPMSQGTRCHQLALYVILDSPLNMLCDSPSNYRLEQECTDVISSIPTVWDETKVLDGKIGEYIVMARRKGDSWYIGGITDWNSRQLTIDLSFIKNLEKLDGVLFKDGVNAHKIAKDYKKDFLLIDIAGKVNINLAPGGGFLLMLKN